MHWAHEIEDNNTLVVYEYYHSFNSFTVRNQYNKGGYQCGYQNEDTEEDV